MDTVAQGKIMPSSRELRQVATTFLFSTFAWIFFRAETLAEAFSYIRRIFSWSILSVPKEAKPESIIPFLLILIIVEWIQREKSHGLDFSDRNVPAPLKIACCYVVMVMIMLYHATQQTFLYFQF